MAIKDSPFIKRTPKQLTDSLREMLNRLQMRDWQIDLEVGSFPPDDLKANYANAASVSYDLNTLKAVIFINPEICARDNQDPMWNLYHEIFHIWLNYQDSEERQCNILASLCM